jgi:hypothetical protein
VYRLQLHRLLSWNRYIEFTHVNSRSVGRPVRAGSRCVSFFLLSTVTISLKLRSCNALWEFTVSWCTVWVRCNALWEFTFIVVYSVGPFFSSYAERFRNLDTVFHLPLITVSFCTFVQERRTCREGNITEFIVGRAWFWVCAASGVRPGFLYWDVQCIWWQHTFTLYEQYLCLVWYKHVSNIRLTLR